MFKCNIKYQQNALHMDIQNCVELTKKYRVEVIYFNKLSTFCQARVNLKGHHDNQKKVKYANLPHHAAANTSVFFFATRFCRLSVEPKRHMVVQRRFVGQADPNNPIKDTEIIAHICLTRMKSNACQTINPMGYRSLYETEAPITKDTRCEEADLI